MSKISIIMFYNNKLGYTEKDFDRIIQSVVNQNYADWELLIVDERGTNASYPKISNHANIHHLPGNFENRAQALNHSITQATGDYIMLVNNLQSPITFRLSTLEMFWAIAQRHSILGMIYSDYCLVDKDGTKKDVHLLDHHEGRLRDNMDFGPVWFFPKQVLNHVGGLNEKYQAAFLYDLRLRVSEKFKLAHIAAAKNGFTYYVQAAETKQDVFDYLRSGKKIQLEMEDALTAHLKRIGAYLAPEANYHQVKYTAEEEKKFEQCIASVVIPVFNREEFIGTAIESVQAQTVQNVE
ncbi:MAG TPA: glycosyltransferase, partial [bacterium]